MKSLLIWLLSFAALSVQDVSLTFLGNGCCRGPNIKVLKEINNPTTTLAACQRACLLNPLCVAMDFARGTDCFLWTGNNQGVAAACTTSDTSSYCYTKPTDPTLPPAPIHAWNLDTDIVSQISWGVDRSGNDLKQFLLSSFDMDACRRSCNDEPQCVVWAISIPDHWSGKRGDGGQQWCWLKTALGTPTLLNTRVTGVKAHIGDSTPCTGSAGVCVSDGRVWTRIYHCQTGIPHVWDQSPDLIKALAKQATSVRIYNPDGRFVQSYPNTFPIDNLRKGDTLSFKNRKDFSNKDVIKATWHGDPDLLERMWNSCGQGADMTTNMYWACNNAQGLHLLPSGNLCEWSYSNHANKEISIWIDGGLDFPDLGTKGTTVATGYNLKSPLHDASVTFQGNSGSYINLTMTALEAITTPSYTISFWVKKSSPNNAALFTDRTTGSHGQFISFRQWPNFITFELDNNNAPYIALSNAGVNSNDGKWHHVAAVVDSTSMVFLYIDGTSVGSASYQNIPLDNTWPLFLGREPNAPDYGNMDGAIAAVQIFDVALKPEQVASLANSGGEESVCNSGYVLNTEKNQCVAGSPPGPTGVAGPNGPPGNTGPSGPPGSVGTIGATGPTGAPGPTGNTGPKGEKGDPGAGGAAGALGPSGETGMAGRTGDVGPPGIPGIVPAYNGPPIVPGSTGPTGATGTTGHPGAVGPMGNTGAPGNTGYPGATGDLGIAGITGKGGQPGPQGPKGSTGNAGPKGPKGETGVSGDTGVIGATGPVGGTGYPGQAGANGATGPTGPAGSTGAPGAAGADVNVVDVQSQLDQKIELDVKNKVLDDTPKKQELKPYSDDEFQRKVKERADEMIKKKILLAVTDGLEHMGVSASLTALRDEIWALKRRAAYAESLQDDLPPEKLDLLKSIPELEQPPPFAFRDKSLLEEETHLKADKKNNKNQLHHPSSVSATTSHTHPEHHPSSVSATTSHSRPEHHHPHHLSLSESVTSSSSSTISSKHGSHLTTTEHTSHHHKHEEAKPAHGHSSVHPESQGHEGHEGHAGDKRTQLLGSRSPPVKRHQKHLEPKL